MYYAKDWPAFIWPNRKEGNRRENGKMYSLSKNNLIREILIYIHLIREGRFLRDKASIVLYLLYAPFRYFLKRKGKRCSYKLIFDVTIKNKDGLFFCGQSFTSCKAVSTFYEKNLRRYFDIREGVFIDVGSHIGKYSIRIGNALGSRGKVIAIEPEINNFKILKKNAALNKLNNIHLLNAACFKVDGKIPLFFTNNYTTLHSIYFRRGYKKIFVNALKLDTIVSQLKVKNVDLIKIDVEGAEKDVIKGAEVTLHRFHPRIVFEAWDEKRFNQMHCFLRNYNYQIKKIDEENYLAY
jgi:FkbM family methyltransferase